MAKKWFGIPLLGRWLVGFIIVLLGISFLIGPGPKRLKIWEPGFGTTSSSLLFFKNVRSYFYEIDATSKSPMVIYRLKRWPDDSRVRFHIISNPMMDEAYIYMEAGKIAASKDLTAFSWNVEEERYERVRLARMNNEDHYLIAATAFESLLKEEDNYLVSGTDTLVTFFRTEAERLSAEIALEDYFKLINKY